MSSNNSPAISVVIPVKNEAKKIRACIEGILSQTVPVIEVVVVDSGSTDGTLEVLKEYEIVKVLQIPPDEFNHGQTRNLGVSHTNGEFVLLTVGDARAYNEFWIEELLKGFADEEVAGVCGQQVVPHDTDKNPVEWFMQYSKPAIKKYKFTKEEFDNLSALDKRRVCGWDDVTAMYRSEVIKSLPFRTTSYAEDAQWAKDAIIAGYSIVYNPSAIVYHYHLEDPDYAFKRSYTVMYHMFKFFDLVPQVPEYDLINRLRMMNAIRKAEGVRFKDKLKWWKYNIESQKGYIKAAKEIIAAIEKGEDFLDKQHQELCGKPPIPKKS